MSNARVVHRRRRLRRSGSSRLALLLRLLLSCDGPSRLVHLLGDLGLDGRKAGILQRQVRVCVVSTHTYGLVGSIEGAFTHLTHTLVHERQRLLQVHQGERCLAQAEPAVAPSLQQFEQLVRRIACSARFTRTALQPTGQCS